MIADHELRAVHGRGAGRGAPGARAGRAADRRGRRRRRRDGRPGPRPGRARRTTRRPTPSSWPCARRPASSVASGSPTSRSSRPSSRARCASARCSRATSRRSSTPSPTAWTGPRAPSSSSPSTPPAARRLDVVSGIRRDEAEELFAAATAIRSALPGRSGGPAGRRLCYPLPRRGVRVVDGAALEKRCAKAAWVRIPPSPPPRTDGRTPPRTSAGAGPAGLRSHVPGERSPSGLWRRTGNAVRGNPSRVRIPPSPPHVLGRRRCRGVGPPRSSLTDLRVRSLRSSRRLGPIVRRESGAILSELARLAELAAPIRTVNFAGRARRGTSGALYLQSAPAGLNSLPRSPFSKAAASSDVEDRVPRSGELANRVRSGRKQH